MNVKRNFRILIYPLMVMGVFLTLTSSCKKSAEGNGATNNPTPNATVTDIDGNVYHTVKIGTQVWMVENLKTTKYRNGNPIPNVTDDMAWINLTSGAYCNYNNDANNSTTYGKLYNWYAVNDSRNIAPTGWHVPSDAEWSKLTTYLGGEGVAGDKLKETGTTHWPSPNSGATNEAGFTALPGGNRYFNGLFSYIGREGTWWCSALGGSGLPWYRIIHDNYRYIEHYNFDKIGGFSVRCLQD